MPGGRLLGGVSHAVSFARLESPSTTTMPKRKAPAKPADENGDGDDVMQYAAAEAPPAKRGRGRPKAASKSNEPAPPEDAPKKPGKRGRPKGSRNSSEKKATEASTVTSNDELDAVENATPQTKFKPAGRVRKRVDAEADDEFQYTPSQSRVSIGKPGPSPTKNHEDTIPETQAEVDESILADQPVRRSVSASPTKTYNRLAAQRALQNSPSKRRPDETGDPELRRRLGDLTKKCDTLENRYNRLRDIGVVQANANMDKLRKHCDTITEGMLQMQFAV